MKKKIIKLNQEQKKDLLTVEEQLDILEEENVLLKSDIDELCKKVEQVQETIVRLEAESVIQKFKIRSSFGNLQSTRRIVLRLQNTVNKTSKRVRRI